MNVLESGEIPDSTDDLTSQEEEFLLQEMNDSGVSSQDTAADEDTKDEDGWLEKKNHEHIRSLKLANDQTEQNMLARKDYASKLFTLLALWLFGVFCLISNISLGKAYLSDDVLVALIYGTTAKVIGLFGIVVYYLFPPIKK